MSTIEPLQSETHRSEVARRGITRIALHILVAIVGLVIGALIGLLGGVFSGLIPFTC